MCTIITPWSRRTCASRVDDDEEIDEEEANDDDGDSEEANDDDGDSRVDDND